MIAEAVKHMLAAGMPHDAIVAAVADMEAAIPVVETRSKGAIRTQRWRDNKASQSVTERHDVTEVTETSRSPSLDKESFPQTPFKEIKPNPEHIRARKAAGFPAPEGVNDDLWNTFASQRKKRLTQIAYDRILNTLEDGKRAGWPPGEMIARAIERGWETIFVPKEERNGSYRNGSSAARPADGFAIALRRAEQATRSADYGPTDHDG